MSSAAEDRRVAQHKENPRKSPMTDTERREVLEAIARDTDAYPRDRIAAVRALEDMDDGKQSPAQGFEQLDGSENVAQIRRKAA